MQLGSTFHGRYRIEEVIGHGGCATVYRCTDLQCDEQRALKVLLPGRPQRLARRLRNEARAMMRIDHPNVLRVFDVNVEEGDAYIVTELADTSLADLASETGIAPVDALKWMLQVLSALSEAHEIGVIHRDVKPQNILLTHDRRAVLADFGIALDYEGSRHTNVGSALGSVAFMAPEQRLDASSVDLRADLYACATTIYHLVTGKNPVDLFLEGENSKRLSTLPPMLRATLLRATRHEPSRRFASAIDMAAAVSSAVHESKDMPFVSKKVPSRRPAGPSDRDVRKALGRLGPQFLPPRAPDREAPALAPAPSANSPCAPTLPIFESERIESLHKLKILDTPAEERFDRHVRVVQQLLNVPIALISLVDSSRQWFKSRQGLQAEETPRDVSFCAHALHHPGQILEVGDTNDDPRFRHNALVTGKTNIRFYAGHPLMSPSGLPIGTLCVIDHEPRELSSAQRVLLADLASLVQDELLYALNSTIDRETGLSNLKGFTLHTQRALSAATPDNWTLVRILLEVDTDDDEVSEDVLAVAQSLTNWRHEPAVVARTNTNEFSLLTRFASDLPGDLADLQAQLSTNVGLRWSMSRYRGAHQDTLAGMMARTGARLERLL